MFVRPVLLLALVSVFFAAITPDAAAQPRATSSLRYSALLDTDRDVATGCSLFTPAGVVHGIEWRIVVRADDRPARLQTIDTAPCMRGRFAADLTHAVDVDLRLNPKLGGADAIATAVAVTELGSVAVGALMHLLSEGEDGAGLGFDPLGLETQMFGDGFEFIEVSPWSTHEDEPLSTVLVGEDVVNFSIVQLPIFGTLGPITPLSTDLAQVVYTPPADFHGIDTFRYVSNDGNADSLPTLVRISVASVNDAPQFVLSASAPDSLWNEGLQSLAGFAQDIRPGPPQESGQSLIAHVQIESASGDLAFDVAPAIDPVSGELSYAAAAGTTGEAMLSVVFQDDGGTDNGGSDSSASQSFTLRIGDPDVAIVGEALFVPAGAEIELAGEHCFSRVRIYGGVRVAPYDEASASGGALTLRSTYSLLLADGAWIDADGAGHRGGAPSPQMARGGFGGAGIGAGCGGGPGSGVGQGGSGGSHSGAGGTPNNSFANGNACDVCSEATIAHCEGAVGPGYGSAVGSDAGLGSGGGAGGNSAGCNTAGGAGGRGGGAVVLAANDRIVLDGRISVVGEQPAPDASVCGYRPGGGGGAGGAILIAATDIEGAASGLLDASGGQGGQALGQVANSTWGWAGGGGGGGRVKLFGNSDFDGSARVDGGAGGTAPPFPNNAAGDAGLEGSVGESTAVPVEYVGLSCD